MGNIEAKDWLIQYFPSESTNLILCELVVWDSPETQSLHSRSLVPFVEWRPEFGGEIVLCHIVEIQENKFENSGLLLGSFSQLYVSFILH